MTKKLRPVVDYKEPEYPELNGNVKLEEVDCGPNDVCSIQYCYNGAPAYQWVGCFCEEGVCECGNNGPALPWS